MRNIAGKVLELWLNFCYSKINSINFEINKKSKIRKIYFRPKTIDLLFLRHFFEKTNAKGGGEKNILRPIF